MKNKELSFHKLFKPIAEDIRLTPTGRLAAMYIYTFHSFKKDCFASNSRIAKKIGVSSSAVDTAIKELIRYGYIEDHRQDSTIGYIKVNCPQICNAEFYKFYNTILKSSLKTSSKFLLTYILSYHNSGKTCYASNTNLLKDICLGKSAVGEHAIPELEVSELIEVSNRKGKYRTFLIHKDSNTLAKLKKLNKEQKDTVLKELKPTMKTGTNLTQNSKQIIENRSLMVENSNHITENSNNNRSNNINNNKTYNINNKQLIEDELIIDENELNNKLLQLVRIHLNSIEDEKTINNEHIVDYISNLSLNEKKDLFGKLYSDYDDEISISPSTEKEIKNELSETNLDSQSENEIKGITSTEEKIESKIQPETIIEAQPSTEKETLELTFETLLNRLSQSENGSTNEASIALNNYKIGLEETLSRENLEQLNKVPDLTNFINEDSKLLAYYNIQEDEKHYCLFSKVDNKLYLFSMPPFGFDERLFCITNHGTMECENSSPDYIKLGDVRFMVKIKNQEEITDEEYKDKYLTKLYKLTKFQLPNLEFYRSYMEYPEPVMPPETDDNDTLIFGGSNT